MPRIHPIWVVRSPLGGCGHQHSLKHIAMNCAENIAKRHSTISYIEVVKVTRNLKRKADTDPETIEEVAARVQVGRDRLVSTPSEPFNRVTVESD